MSSLRKKGIEFIRIVLARVGYKLKPISSSIPIALPSFDGDPRALRYLRKNRDYLITARLKDGRSLFVFPLSDIHGHPFSGAVKSALDVSLTGGDEREAIRLGLRRFYWFHQPEFAAEVLGVAPKDIPMLGVQPPWVVIKPWEDMTVTERQEKIIRHERKDNSHISKVDMSVEHGCNFCGPVSEEKLEVEVERLYKIMKSIRKNGFIRHDFLDGDIRVELLVDSSGNWKWLVKSGQHRAAVISALGFSSVPVRVGSVVCRDEVDVWPQVLAGNYSRKIALQVFDNIFVGVGLGKGCRIGSPGVAARPWRYDAMFSSIDKDG
ncbi:MAG: hypothetical protein IBX53_03740 [Halomonas sp.]|uniref:hypothetical protein n=1 Tax=Halomonas sp. TaxID=1486246 RepID=UPI001A0D8F66|nr:hypothetical protein [Halomonas sp.]MBE0488169.1 hypothetical protein [Halomonas sp.]